MERRIGPGGSVAGLSILELMVTAVVLAVLVYVMTTLAISGSRAQKFAERLNRVTEIAQNLTDDLRRELTSSVLVFDNSATGMSYLGVIELGSHKTPIPSRLARLDVNGIFEKDVGSVNKTGNAMLFARHAWRTRFTTTGGNPYRVDVYRLVYYYLAAEENGPQAGSAVGLNLVKWVSEPLADASQIDKITSSVDRDEVCRHLLLRTPDEDGVVHPRVEVVWERDQSATQADTFRHIQSSGMLASTPQAPRPAPWRIYSDPTWSAGDMLHARHHSVATVHANPGWGVGTFGQLATGNGGFPHGLETQIIGPASARQVLFRIVIVSTNRNGHQAHTALQSVVDVRDL